MRRALYVAWQDKETRTWHTIAKLTRESTEYELAFTKGARRLGTIPQDLFGMRTQDIFRFDELLPVFKNRLPTRGRADFNRLLAWLNLNGTEDEFALLSRFGLIPGSDSFLLYPEPIVSKGVYSLEFFVHGIRHMHSAALDFCRDAKAGDKVFAVLDVQNPVDPNAVALRTQDQILLGYVPAFYAEDLHKILVIPTTLGVEFSVVRNNLDAPLQIRLLCSVRAEVGPNFRPLDDDAHRTLWQSPNTTTALAGVRG